MTEFRSLYPDFQASGIGVYAISVDSVFSHQAFAEELGGLPFEMLSDFERTAVADWGVRRDDVEGYRGSANRAVFVLDADGVVRWRWIRTTARGLPDPAETLAEAKKVAEETAG